MSLLVTLCVTAAAIVGLAIGVRLLLEQIRDTGESLEPHPAPVNGAESEQAPALCKECRRRFPANELVCPHCGEPQRVVRGPMSWLAPVCLVGVACIAYTGSFDQLDEVEGANQPWSRAPALQKLRFALITELEREQVITAIHVAPHSVTVEVQPTAFRALQQFEQQTIGGTVFGYYFDGTDTSDFVALVDAKTRQGLGWFNRWGLHLEK